jgi:hypothetical protein
MSAHHGEVEVEFCPTLVPLSRADREKEQNLIDLHINM